MQQQALDVQAAARDQDADGYDSLEFGGEDCEELDPNIHPGAPEVCDGVDNNCSGAVDEGLETATWFPDLDTDGYGDPAGAVQNCANLSGHVLLGGDCDDSNNQTYPGAAEKESAEDCMSD